MTARAIVVAKPMDRTPARDMPEPTPKHFAPARAMLFPESNRATPARASGGTSPIEAPPARDDLGPMLLSIRTLGETLDDLERVRIANSNRIAAMERELGSSLPHLEVVSKQLAAVEHLAELELKRAWRKHPLAPWAKSVPGCGEKLIARLIAVIGDPAERENPAKLWAYCGHGNPALKRSRGMTQEQAFALGNPTAKKRTWLLAAQFCRTMNSPYRELYDEARVRYSERTHVAPCPRCGPAGKPALPGSPWADGHKHAAALRFVGKRFLLDLWREARAGHSIPETQLEGARAGHSSSVPQVAPARAGQGVYDAQGSYARAGQSRSDGQCIAARAGQGDADAHTSSARAGEVVA